MYRWLSLMAEIPRRRTGVDLSDLYTEIGSIAGQLTPDPTPTASSRSPRRRRRPKSRLVTAGLLIAGLGFVAGGIYVIATPLIGVWQRGGADDQALKDWKSGGSQALVGRLTGAGAAGDTHDVSAPVGACNSATVPADDYALVSFPTLSKYGYAGVAGNGTWDELKSRSMVHYTGTPDPGQAGNVIIGFHREPHYEHIDDLKAGDAITVQDRSCHVFHYTVTQRWVLDPDNVTQLNPTTGHDLTLVTCTPFWVDSQRIVWRATLTG